MRISDHIRFSFDNLRKRKLRTFLTAFGVTVGIGALAAMLSFGLGVQENITGQFEALALFNSVTVLGQALETTGTPPEKKGEEKEEPLVLDDGVMERLERLNGVAAVFPEIQFPAQLKFKGREEFRLIQVLPARVASTELLKLEAGRPFASDEEKALIISRSLLRRLGVEDARKALGETVELTSLSFDLARVNPLDLSSLFSGHQPFFSAETYSLTVVGAAESAGLGGPGPLRSEVFIPPGTARGIKTLPFTSVWDIFRAEQGLSGYSALNIRLESPRHLDSVRREVEAMGLRTFALSDQFREIRTGFLIMDMMLLAIGMIAVFVASLGIINTMIMSILERQTEIGIMKAVGAGDRDIKRIFFVESASIGFMGGVSGLGLGWVVSRFINAVMNAFLARQGVPSLEYFFFPWWLCAGAVGFAVIVSLVSGVYPAVRASRVDPVVALRRE